MTTANLLDVRNLHVTYRSRGRRGVGEVHAVDGVSLSITPGETLGLVGESGCGKTSLLKAVLGIQPPSAGTVSIGGRALHAMGRRERRAQRSRMQVVFQDPYSSLDPRMSVHDIVAEPLRIHRRYRAERVHEVLDQVGIGREHEQRKPSDFSGGQRQRIGIAHALALQPELLILDEPVSALDVSIQAQVINLLTQLQQQLGLSYLFVAHDLSVVRHMSTRIAVMYFGRLVEVGEADHVFRSPQHPYTRSLLAAVPHPDPAGREARRVRVELGEPPDPADRPAGCSFRDRCPDAAAECMTAIPTLQRHGDTTQEAACFRVRQAAAA